MNSLPFIVEMKVLVNGKIMDVQGTKGIVFASLGDVTADLPQGNDLARIKRHGATRGVEPVMPPKIPGQLTILISCVITILQTLNSKRLLRLRL